MNFGKLSSILISSMLLYGCGESCKVENGQVILSKLKGISNATVVDSRQIKNSHICEYIAKTPNNAYLKFYTTSKYVIPGNIIDSESNANIDNTLLWKYQKINKEAVDELKRYSALKFGTGKKQLIMIGDPECQYCDQLSKTFTDSQLAEYTIHYIMYPLGFHTIGQVAAYQLVCSPEKDALKSQIKNLSDVTKLAEIAINTIKANGNKVPQADICNEMKLPYIATTKILQTNGIKLSTPILIKDNGTWELGALSKEQLEAFLK